MGSVEQEPEGKMGRDFADEQTNLEMQLIDDLQSLNVSDHIHLPQLVVVGDQSTGKSSVLQAVTDIPFQIQDGMCTRFATEIELKRSATTEIDVKIIPDKSESLKRQEAMRSWRPDGFSKSGSLDKETMRSFFQQAKDFIIGKENEVKEHLNSSTLRITRSGPLETNFSIVDIPGLVRGNENDQDHTTARRLVNRYMKNPRTIVVVVIDLIDLKRQEILTMLSDLPDKESRMVGVINKCDRKQENAENWVFELIRNSRESKQYLKEGWYGLRNRTEKERECTDLERDQREEAFFACNDWKFLDKEKLGRHHLKKALIRMRNQHIRRSIPKLVSEIQTRLDQCLAYMEELGPPRHTDYAQYTLITSIATKYSKMAENSLDGRYRNLPSDLRSRMLIRQKLERFQQILTDRGPAKPFRTDFKADGMRIGKLPLQEWAGTVMQIPIYEWISQAIKTYRGNELDGDVNPDVKDILFKKQIINWTGMATDALNEIERAIESINASLFKEACPDSELRSRLRSWLAEDFGIASREAKNELDRLFEDEITGHISTLHPYRRHNEDLLKIERLVELEVGLKTNPGITRGTQEDRVAVIQKFLFDNPEIDRIWRTHDSLCSYYYVSMHRFIDNFALQVVERHLLGPRGPLRLFSPQLVSERFYGEQNNAKLNELAGEHPNSTKKREVTHVEIKSLEACRKRLQSFQI